MIYLTEADLKLEAFERFINESTVGENTVIDDAEKAVIGIVKTFLSNYDVTDIFDEDEPIRDEFLAKLMSIMVVYEILSRNAARKLNSDMKEEYLWAFKQLEKIQTGRVQLDLPPKLDEAGASNVPTMYGNNTNTDFYI